MCQVPTQQHMQLVLLACERTVSDCKQRLRCTAGIKLCVSACVVWLQAIAATGKIVKSNPKHLEALQLRGMAYMYLGDHDLAKRHFGKHASFALLGALALLLKCQFAALRVLPWRALIYDRSATSGHCADLGCSFARVSTPGWLCSIAPPAAADHVHVHDALCVSPHCDYVYPKWQAALCCAVCR